jgi:hypothetical protein
MLKIVKKAIVKCNILYLYGSKKNERAKQYALPIVKNPYFKSKKTNQNLTL